jgi:hypothetical protein
MDDLCLIVCEEKFKELLYRDNLKFTKPNMNKK